MVIPAKVSGKLFALYLFLFVIFQSKCSIFVEDGTCGTLHYEDSVFILKDFDQSANTRKDYRSSLSGWGNTTSIHVEDNCTMHVCNSTYFQGTCVSVSQGIHEFSELISPILSANCTCQKVCNCMDIPVSSKVYGRAYLKGACRSCDSEYVQLYRGRRRMSAKYRNSFDTILLRNSCNVIVFSETNDKGETFSIDESVSEGLQLPYDIASYSTYCEDQENPFHYSSQMHSDLIEIPEDDDELRELVASSDESSASHPGLQAALKSLENGRSPRNAYILLIGATSPAGISLRGCKSVLNASIGECQIFVNLAKLDISNAQLRVIYLPIGSPFDIVENDNQWVKTLQDYLSNHEELSDKLPNAVVIYSEHLIGRQFPNIEAHFQRKLKLLEQLKDRIVDKDYSNVVFVVGGLNELPQSLSRNPEKVLNKIETAINQNSTLPKPTFLALRKIFQYHYPKINGHRKMDNEEYWPKNLQDKLMLVSEMNGDALGQAIFQAAYPTEEELKVVKDPLPDDYDFEDEEQ